MRARCKKRVVEELQKQLAQNSRELDEMNEKLKRASSENCAHFQSCGKCHLKLGHTRKSCNISPCKSAFSCGSLSKHPDQKALKTNLDRARRAITTKLEAARADVAMTKSVAAVKNSQSKKIEQIILDISPTRYISNGLRNWQLLNRDVAKLSTSLQGKLPSRQDVMPLLGEMINGSDGRSSTDCRRQAERKMQPQTQVLQESYGISFPSQSKPCSSSSKSSSSFSSQQEEDDFMLALRLQNEEADTVEDETEAANALLCLKKS